MSVARRPSPVAYVCDRCRYRGVWQQVTSRGVAMSYRLWVVLSFPVALSATRAQVIAVKTAPIADGGQFAFLPSANLGMGGVSIAVTDSALDPFTNPAKGARLRGMHVFGAPTFFSVTRKAGGGLTLPIGASFSRGPWFSQVVLAMQDIDRVEQSTSFPPPVLAASTVPVVTGSVTDDQGSRENRYAQGTIGRRFAGGWSVASSASWWRLNALDGVDLYYPTSFQIKQRGNALDLRLGVLKELGRDHSFEAVAVHNRFEANQDVSFMDMFWDPTLRQITGVPRVEPNADRTETWGLHLAYMRPLADSTWRVGAIVTGNYIRQPSVAPYELPEVAADEGRARAFDIGGGVARSTGPFTVGFDAIYEPIWNHTWVFADDAADARDGTPLTAGSRVLDNQFRFNNAIARLGFSAAFPFSTGQTLTVETGGQLRAIRYRLDQEDAVQQSTTSSTQHWNEWTRSWGLSLRFAGATIRYRGNLTTGASRPGFDDNGGIIAVADAAPVRSFVQTTGIFGLTFDGVRTTTHQISFSVPIR